MGGEEARDRLADLSRWPLATFMVVAGVSHFTMTEDFLGQVPPVLPAPEALIAVTGVMEVGLGLGLAFLPRRWRPAAGWALAAFLVAVFPGNVYQAVAGTDAFGLDTPAARWLRLPFQPLLIAWALWSSGALRRRADPGSSPR